MRSIAIASMRAGKVRSWSAPLVVDWFPPWFRRIHLTIVCWGGGRNSIQRILSLFLQIPSFQVIAEPLHRNRGFRPSFVRAWLRPRRGIETCWRWFNNEIPKTRLAFKGKPNRPEEFVPWFPIGPLGTPESGVDEKRRSDEPRF
jgi:hypothetical protein